MKRTISVIVALTGMLGLGACTAPSVRALHSPMQPKNSETVTFTATAHAPEGLAEITLWQREFRYNGDCAAWVAGKCVPLPSFVVSPLRTCTFASAPIDGECTAVAGPFPDDSFITYGATTKDTRGDTAEDRWIGFAAGGTSTPDEPIPIYVRDDSQKSTDIIFVPDQDYARNLNPAYSLKTENQQFVADVERLIKSGYFANELIDSTRARWNFYVTYRRGSVVGAVTQPAAPAPAVPSCRITQPSNWANLAAVADAVGYVHTRTIGSDGNPFRDCAPGFVSTGANGFMITASGSPSTSVHETGHAAFGLSDEYCCDGGIIPTTWPHQNMFTSQSACQASANAHGVPAGDCVQITATTGFCGGTVPAPAGSPPGTPPTPALGGTNNQWRQDVANDLMGCGANIGGPFGTLDTQRILWYYDNH